MINYQKILDKNMLSVFKDILRYIRDNGLSNNNHLYITFLTSHKNVDIPNWIKQKYPEEMTIVIQYEYWNLKVFEKKFEILLSFNDIRSNLSIPFQSIISFADPYANFGLKIRKSLKKKSLKKNKKDNIIEFNKFKKLK